ncbi:uncharacterized protein [Ptychodera flava]|uniref:uncharacterized protein n=1 Tax=Ptychodera flava TaxID=63121 RepID=UPI00396A1AD1
MASVEKRPLKWELRSRVTKPRHLLSNDCNSCASATQTRSNELPSLPKKKKVKRKANRFHREDEGDDVENEDGEMYPAGAFCYLGKQMAQASTREDSNSSCEIGNHGHPASGDTFDDCFVVPETPSPRRRPKGLKRRKLRNHIQFTPDSSDLSDHDVHGNEFALPLKVNGASSLCHPCMVNGSTSEDTCKCIGDAIDRTYGTAGQSVFSGSTSSGLSQSLDNPNEALPSDDQLATMVSGTHRMPWAGQRSHATHSGVISMNGISTASKPSTSRTTLSVDWSSLYPMDSDSENEIDPSDQSTSPVFGHIGAVNCQKQQTTTSKSACQAQEQRSNMGTTTPSDAQETRPSRRKSKKRLGYVVSGSKFGPPPRGPLRDIVKLQTQTDSIPSPGASPPLICIEAEIVPDELTFQTPDVQIDSEDGGLGRDEMNRGSGFNESDEGSGFDEMDRGSGFDELDGPGEPNIGTSSRASNRRRQISQQDNSGSSRVEGDFLPASVLIDPPQIIPSPSSGQFSEPPRGSEQIGYRGRLRRNRQVTSTPVIATSSAGVSILTSPLAVDVTATQVDRTASASRGGDDSGSDSTFYTPPTIDLLTPAHTGDFQRLPSTSRDSASLISTSGDEEDTPFRLEHESLSPLEEMSPPTVEISGMSPPVIELSGSSPSFITVPTPPRQNRSRYSRSPFVSATPGAAAPAADSSTVSPGTMASIARLEQIEADEAFAWQLQEQLNRQSPASGVGASAAPTTDDSVPFSLPVETDEDHRRNLPVETDEDDRPSGASPVRNPRIGDIFQRTEERRTRLMTLINQSEQLLNRMNERLGSLQHTMLAAQPLQRRRRGGIVSSQSPRRRTRTHNRDQFREQLENLDRQLMRLIQARERRQGTQRGRQPRRVPLLDRSLSGATYEELLELHDQLGPSVNHGLTKSQLDQLPLFDYLPENDREDNTCNICFVDYERNEALRRLPCFHRYHAECIDPWLKQNPTCPVCRVRVTT